VIDLLRRLTPQPERYVCLDFGRDHLSALEVFNGAVTRWIAVPLAEEDFDNGSPADPKALAAGVAAALRRAGMEAQTARIALPDEATVSRQLQLPAMPRRDLARAMHFAAERHIPFPLARARWAWDVVERTPEQLTVYLVATWVDVVDRFTEVAREAALEPQVLEPRAVAVARALGRDHALLLDAGPHRLHATLLVGGQPAFVDTVMAGPADRREALDRLLQRVYRQQSAGASAGGRLAPLLLAGDLELSELKVPVEGRMVGEVLNGQLPATPRGFPAGSYLANLGLSMRTPR
jgi:type IV pilus assembly PilM-like protein